MGGLVDFFRCKETIQQAKTVKQVAQKSRHCSGTAIYIKAKAYNTSISPQAAYRSRSDAFVSQSERAYT